MRRSGQRIAVCAHREESNVTQIQQPRVPHHDVQSQSQHDVEHRKIHDAHPAASEQRIGDEGQQQQTAQRQAEHQVSPGEFKGFHARSARRSPSKPAGLNTSTAISTKKANTS